MKWGTLYGPDYVNRLYSMVRRNVTGAIRFVCLTDDPTGIREEVECHPCPELDVCLPQRNRGWRKLTLFDKTVVDLTGDVLFLDLDLVITDSIDCFFEWGEDFCVMRNWTQPKKRIGNTSVYKFTVGEHSYLLENLQNNYSKIFEIYSNSQTYISENISQMTFWPDDWCRLFKLHCVPSWPLRWVREPHLPVGARVIAFPGQPNPEDAATGTWPAPWYKKTYKHVRPSQWVQQHWQ